eukprot:m.25303 g.25303  ORF g.25303 m.25303 type:complete len:762 (+) comp5752_c0_seq1:111-2396(+)
MEDKGEEGTVPMSTKGAAYSRSCKEKNRIEELGIGSNNAPEFHMAFSEMPTLPPGDPPVDAPPVVTPLQASSLSNNARNATVTTRSSSSQGEEEEEGDDTLLKKRPKRGIAAQQNNKKGKEILSFSDIHTNPGQLKMRLPLDRHVPPIYGAKLGKTEEFLRTDWQKEDLGILLPNSTSVSSPDVDMTTTPPLTSSSSPSPHESTTLAQTDMEDNSDNVCVTCGQGGELVCCESCPRVSHPFCANPPIIPASEEDWFCRACISKQVEKKKKGKRQETPSGACEPYISIMQFLFSSNPKSFSLPDTLLQAIPLDVKYKLLSGQRPAKTARVRGTPSQNNNEMTITCFKCMRVCPPNKSAQCSICGTMFHFDCVYPPISRLHPLQPWRCPLHPPGMHGWKYETALLGLTDFESWMYTATAEEDFVKKLKGDRFSMLKANEEEQQLLLDSLVSINMESSIVNSVTKNNTQGKETEKKRKQKNSHLSTPASLSKALTMDVAGMKSHELVNCVLTLRKALKYALFHKSSLVHPTAIEEADLDVNMAATLMNLHKHSPMIPYQFCLRNPSNGARLNLDSSALDGDNSKAYTVGFSDFVDINLSQIVSLEIDPPEEKVFSLLFSPGSVSYSIRAHHQPAPEECSQPLQPSDMMTATDTITSTPLARSLQSSSTTKYLENGFVKDNKSAGEKDNSVRRRVRTTRRSLVANIIQEGSGKSSFSIKEVCVNGSPIPIHTPTLLQHNDIISCLGFTLVYEHHTQYPHIIEQPF